MCGHSVGEYVAATVAGVLTLEDGLRLIAARGCSMADCDPNGGVMMAIRAAEDTLLRAMDEVIATAQPKLLEKVAIAATNGPKSSVLAGDGAWVDLVLKALPEGVGASKLAVSHAFHSPMMKEAVGPFREVLKTVTLRPPEIPIVSNLSGAFVYESIARPAHWEEHLQGCVKFSEGVKCLVDAGVTVFLEVGAHPTLSRMGLQAGAHSLFTQHAFARLKA